MMIIIYATPLGNKLACARVWLSFATPSSLRFLIACAP